MANDLENSMGKRATDFFVEVLQKMSKSKHHLKLFNDLFERCDADVKEYYQTFSESQKCHFFQSRAEFFNFSAGYVSLKPFLKKTGSTSQKCAKKDIKSFANIKNMYSSLPCEVDLDIELANAFSADESSTEEQVIQCFVQYLSDYGETHYSNLIIWLERSNLDIKDFFAHFKELEKFQFFEDHPNYFIVGSDGFISLLSRNGQNSNKNVAEKAVELLILHLKTVREMHYIKLVKCCEEASSEMKDYFSNFSPLEKYNFFKDHSNLFSIQINGYVSLTSCSNRAQNIQVATMPTVHLCESAEDQVKRFLICRLKTAGSLYFEDLVSSLHGTSLKSKDFFASLDISDILKFFKKNCEFSVDDDGCISLSSEKQVRLYDEQSISALDPKATEDKSIDLLVQFLKTKGIMHYEKLLKLVEEVSPVLKDFFANFSASERYWFFKNRPKVFTIRNDGFVLLPSNAQPSALSKGKQDATLTLIEEFTVHHLEKCDSVQTKVIIKCLNIYNPNILNAFGIDLSDGIICFLKENCRFRTSDTGVLSLALGSTCTSDEKQHTPDIDISNPLTVVGVLVQFLLCSLKNSAPVHYETVIKVTMEISQIANNFFAHFSALGQFLFIHNHPLCLTNDSSECSFPSLSCDDSIAHGDINFGHIMSQVKQFLINSLRTSNVAHCQILIESLESDANVKDFFDCKLSDIFHFLKEYATEFYIDKSGYILIPKEKPKNQSVSTSEMSAVEEKVVQFMVLNLAQLGPVHYEKLVDCLEKSPLNIKDFFTGYSPAYIEWFFKKHKAEFSVQDDGHVLLSLNRDSVSSVSTTQKLTLSEISQPDISVVELITEFLWDAGEIQYEDAVKHVSDTYPVVWQFFASCSPFEVFRFFKERPTKFHVNSNEYVGLAKDTVSSSSPMSYLDKINKVVDFFVSNLKIDSLNHYRNLIKLLSNSKADVHDFFSGCSRSGKIDFFTSLPEVFVIDKFNFVSLAKSGKVCDVEPVLDNEKKVVNMIQDHLVAYFSVHFEKLCSVSSFTKMFFRKFTVSEKFKFFKEHSQYFIINTNGYVQLPDIHASSVVTRSKNPETNLEVQSFSDISVEDKEKVIDMMRSHLVANLSVHFEKLCSVSNFTEDFFQKFTVSEKFKFFKEQNQHFEIDGDGYVYLPYTPTNKKATSLPEDIQNRLEKLFISVIRIKSQNNKKKVTYKAVRPVAMAFNPNLNSVLEKLSHEDIYQFLKARPEYFTWESDHHVSLSTEALNGKMTHIRSKNKSGVVQISKNPFSDCNGTSLVCDSSVKIVTPQVQIAEVNHTSLRCDEVVTRVTVNKPVITASSSSGKCLVEHKSCDANVFAQEGKLLYTWEKVKDSGINPDTKGKENSLIKVVETDCPGSFCCEDNVKSFNSSSADSNVHHISGESSCSDSKSPKSMHVEPSLLSSCGYKLPETALDVRNNFDKCVKQELMPNTIFDDKPSSKHTATLSWLDATTLNRNDKIHVSESDLKVDSKLPNKARSKVTDYFVSVLTTNENSGSKMHYQELANYINQAPEDIKLVFTNFLPNDILLFFSESQQFSIDNNGCVSVNTVWEEKMNAEKEVVNYFRNRICHSLQPCHYETLFTALRDSEIYKKSNISDVFSSYMPDKCKMFFEKYQDCFSVDENGFITLCPEAKSEVLLPSRSKLENEEEIGSHFVFRLSDMHVTAVRYFIDILKARKSLHYEGLLKAVCDDDAFVSAFFSNFILTDVLKFFQIHSLYFSWDSEGIITLKDGRLFTFAALTSYQEIMEVVQMIESEAVKFYISILKDKIKANIFQLECFLGSAPGFVISHFSANYLGTDFLKFFRNYSEYFDVSGECVSLTSKALEEKFITPIDSEQGLSVEMCQDRNMRENDNPDERETLNGTKSFEDNQGDFSNNCNLTDSSKTHPSKCLANKFSTSKDEGSFAGFDTSCTHESIGNAHRCKPKVLQIPSTSRKNDCFTYNKECSFSEGKLCFLPGDNRNSTSAKEKNHHNDDRNIPPENFKLNHRDSMLCNSRHSSASSDHNFGKPDGKITFDVLLHNICAELKSMKQTLNSFTSSQNLGLNLEGHNSPQQKSILKSKLHLAASFFNFEMEKKCIDFFCKILQGETSVSLATLQLHTSQVTSDVKTYLSNCYLSDLSLFFYSHLEYFEVDQHDRVSLRTGLCTKSSVEHADVDVIDNSVKGKVINFFVVILGEFSGPIPYTKLKKCLSYASDEVQQYFLHKYEKTFLHFFNDNSELFETDTVGRITLRKI